MNPERAIRAAYDLLHERRHMNSQYTLGLDFAKDAQGNYCHPLDPHAVEFSIRGALRKVCGRHWICYARCLSLLADHLGTRHIDNWERHTTTRQAMLAFSALVSQLEQENNMSDEDMIAARRLQAQHEANNPTPTVYRTQVPPQPMPTAPAYTQPQDGLQEMRTHDQPCHCHAGAKPPLQPCTDTAALLPVLQETAAPWPDAPAHKEDELVQRLDDLTYVTDPQAQITRDQILKGVVLAYAELWRINNDPNSEHYHPADYAASIARTHMLRVLSPSLQRYAVTLAKLAATEGEAVK